jgi:hypothetical protein
LNGTSKSPTVVMYEFGPLPDELPPFQPSVEALHEFDRILMKTRRSLTVAAVRLAADRESPGRKKTPVAVETEDVLQAAKILFAPDSERPIAWLNDLLDLLVYSSCFLSHSTKDQRFCRRIRQDLSHNGVPTWYFPEDADWGQPVWGQIDRGINLYDKLVVVCSKHSLTSAPVLREIERALQREDDELRRTGKAKHILFPVRLDNFLFDTWQHARKPDVLTKVVGDFRGWNRNPNKYDAAFRKLLSSLQAK